MAVRRRPASPRSVQPTILMGFAEALAAIETAWSLQGAGFNVVAFQRAGSRPPVRRVRGVEVYAVPAPEHDAHATVAAVRALVRRLEPAALLPLDDHALWVCNRLDDRTVPIAGATGRAAACALDKSAQLDLAQLAGLSVPPTQVLDDLADADPVDEPVMVKPALALYEVDGVLIRPTGIVCADASEFQLARERSWPAPLLVQPLIVGSGEGLFGHMGPHGVVGWSAHKRVRMLNPQGSASSACRSCPVDHQLVQASERFLRSLDWHGMFMLEFLRDSAGTPWFMELNGRAWGSMALARRRGFEYPAWTVQATLDPGFEPTPPEHPPEVFCRNVGLEVAHLMFVARGPRSEASTEWPRLSDAVREVCRRVPGARLYNWNPSQPDVFMADTLGTVGHFLLLGLGARR
jgi:hypothetical protein